MNFSKEIKQEIFSKRLPHECCKKAYLAGFIRATGSIIKNSEGYGFEFSSENDGAIEYFTYFEYLCIKK